LGMAVLFAMLLRALRALRRVLRMPAPEVLPITPDQRALLDNALALEARLEHAPIALFRVDAGPDEPVTALNANGRRLLAPGRAADPQALFAQLRALPVDTRRLVSFQTERGDERALAAVSAVTLRGASGRIVALMPVESELEAAALRAWQQLVHVLTHEIMNSLTPVASLSRTAFDLLEELKPQLPADANLDLQVALDAIGRRADSLVSFVGSYRSLSNLPAAKPELVPVADLFARHAGRRGLAGARRPGRFRGRAAHARGARRPRPAGAGADQSPEERGRGDRGHAPAPGQRAGAPGAWGPAAHRGERQWTGRAG